MQHHQLKIAGKALKYATRAWFIVSFLGQLLFAVYIILFYWGTIVQTNYEKWNVVNAHFYAKGDLVGNIAFAVHVSLAAIVTILGPLQLVGQVRLRLPRFHRISGRLYIFTAFLMGLSGLSLILFRGAIGGLFTAIAIGINALIILITAFFTIRRAVQRKIKEHNCWAIHLFTAMMGVWMFRVFFMLWMVIHQAPVGFDPETFTGPFLNTLAVFVYIFPQLIVYWYFRAGASALPAQKWSFAVLLFFLTLCIMVGSFGATMGMWLPRLS
ncbi:MAG TPA: DUF2306 domain-containing protein [Niastella sp.]